MTTPAPTPRLFTLLLLLLTLPACSTTERAAETTADTAEDVAEGTADVAVDVAQGTANVAEDVADFVVDAAGTSYRAVTGLFEKDDEVHAGALLRPTAGSTVQGTVTFEQEDDGTEVELSLHGLMPGEHGIHIHQYGDCSAPDASSAGGHWDPMNTNDHGGPDAEMMNRHLGDLGNFTADSDGTIEAERTIAGLMVEGEGYTLAGQAVIVHSGRDDLETDPAGDAGGRVACGVIALRRN